MALVTHAVQVRPLIHNVVVGLTYSEDFPVYTAGPGKIKYDYITGQKGTGRDGGSKTGSYTLYVKATGLTEFEDQPILTAGPGKTRPPNNPTNPHSPDEAGGRGPATRKCEYDEKQSTSISWTFPRVYSYGVYQDEEIL